MVGISDGALGIWKYTRGYLAEKWKTQHGVDLPESLMKALADRKTDAEDMEDSLARFRGIDLGFIRQVSQSLREQGL